MQRLNSSTDPRLHRDARRLLRRCAPRNDKGGRSPHHNRASIGFISSHKKPRCRSAAGTSSHPFYSGFFLQRSVDFHSSANQSFPRSDLQAPFTAFSSMDSRPKRSFAYASTIVQAASADSGSEDEKTATRSIAVCDLPVIIPRRFSHSVQLA